ncbi:tRNA pseudouridine(55) synthase TruB [Candidatus Saccharibacteria bacterium]|nr:tRNA pseudouridine(55) synthase TruB [Candidatus Saccharibacteria bacterium]
MQGILLIDKPATWTSFDVVNYIRRIVANAEGKKPKNCKVGHTGTLDPFATGLLVVLIGKEYTKKAAELSKVDKTYEVTMKLGARSTTGDPEGEINPVSDTTPTKEELLEALEGFKGQIEQVPPAFSAIKVDGQRAYRLAREGKEVKIEPRKVTINRLELSDYNYPEARLVVGVSSGTYVRTLVEDIGATLKTGGYTVELRRTKVGNYDIADATAVKQLDEELMGKQIRLT